MSSNETPEHEDESWTLAPNRKAQEALIRLIKRGRIVRPPKGFLDGEEYRAWLLDRVAVAASIDTAEERQVTEAWKERITTASTKDLWSEYLGQPHDPIGMQST